MVQGELGEQCQSQPGGAPLAPKVNDPQPSDVLVCCPPYLTFMNNHAVSPLKAAGLVEAGEENAGVGEEPTLCSRGATAWQPRLQLS